MTENHYNLVQQYYAETPQETKDKYEGKSGIYGIYCDGKLVYVGKSTDLLKRFIAHKANTFCSESKEYNSRKYTELRNAAAKGYHIHLEPLEYCGKDVLNSREDFYIGQYQPALNTIIPNGFGGHTKKPVASISWFLRKFML